MPLAYSYVRFSTPEQAQGHSLERQTQKAEAYCREHGLVLDRKLSLRDLGVSSYRGQNATSGTLKIFLDAVKAGRIEPGSILIVENLDRISRDEISNSLELFLGIIRSGVELITLSNGMRYTKSSINKNVMPLMTCLVDFARAHDESAVKAERVGAAWAAKRAKAHEEKLTARAPAWLQLRPDKKSFKVIKNRAALIRRIFRMAISGHGKRFIAAKLNAERIPTWGRGHGWHDSYIGKILANRAVLGECQLHRRTSGKREPIGDPVLNYFPAVVDKVAFAKVHNRRRRPLRGRSGAGVTNLFTQLVKCGFTDLPMHYVNKGTQKRGAGRWIYLQNDGKRLGLPTSSIRYDVFEQAFLSYVRHLDWAEVIDAGKPNERLSALDDQIIGSKTKLEDVGTRLQRQVAIIERSENPPKAILARIAELERQQQQLALTIADLEARQQAEQSQAANVAEDGTSLAKLAANATDYETRIRLREEIRRRVKEIKIFGRFTGFNPVTKQMRPNPVPFFEVTFQNDITRHITLKGFDNADANFALELKGQQLPGVNEPKEDSKPKRYT